mgnify:CR=1 FL=1
MRAVNGAPRPATLLSSGGGRPAPSAAGTACEREARSTKEWRRIPGKQRNKCWSLLRRRRRCAIVTVAF